MEVMVVVAGVAKIRSAATTVPEALLAGNATPPGGLRRHGNVKLG